MGLVQREKIKASSIEKPTDVNVKSKHGGIPSIHAHISLIYFKVTELLEPIPVTVRKRRGSPWTKGQQPSTLKDPFLSNSDSPQPSRSDKVLIRAIEK